MTALVHHLFHPMMLKPPSKLSSLIMVYRQLPEVSSLYWEDDYFSDADEDDDDIVAVFDLYVDPVWVLQDTYWTSKLSCFVCFVAIQGILVGPTAVFYVLLLCCVLSILVLWQLSRYDKAQHVAVTVYGVQFVVDPHIEWAAWWWRCHFTCVCDDGASRIISAK
jgi:hypothetical protein